MPLHTLYNTDRLRHSHLVMRSDRPVVEVVGVKVGRAELGTALGETDGRRDGVLVGLIVGATDGAYDITGRKDGVPVGTIHPQC